MNPSDEIKSRLDIVDVLREYIQLKPAGINFRANCPFHNEKSPSFMVSSEKQIWHCFGCGKGGDIFAFVMEMEGVSFVEALRLLAPKAGVELKAVDAKANSVRNRSMDAMQLASRYYNHILMENKVAAGAREYLEKRGLTEETIEAWQIGYSPDSWEDLVNFLLSRGFKENEILSAGLCIKKEGTNKYYNRFRGRIMFPISDANGNVVAFTARVSPEKEATEQMGKYINSPQTQLYDKSKILFGLDKAKNKIRSEDLAIIVEGQMDVITAHQHGFKNVVASSGTALTTEQIGLIKRYTKNIALALDSDSAGQSAIVRGEDVVEALDYQEVDSEDKYGRVHRYVDQGQSFNINIKIIEIPGSKDPDECIKNNPEDWQRAVENAKDVMQYNFDRTIAGLDLEKIENRRKIVDYLLPKIARLGEKNKTEQDFWTKKLSQALNINELDLREEMALKNKTAPDRNNQAERQDKKKAIILEPKSREELISELLLALALKYPEHLSYIMNNIQLDQLWGPANLSLYKSLIIYYNSIDESLMQSNLTQEMGAGLNPASLINYSDFRVWLTSQEEADSLMQPKISSVELSQPAQLDRLALLAEKDFFTYDSDQVKQEIIKIVLDLKRNYLSGRLKETELEIARTEKANNTANLQLLLEEFKQLSEELKEVNSMSQ